MRRLPNAYDQTALPLEVREPFKFPFLVVFQKVYHYFQVGDVIRVTNRACSGQWEGTIKGTNRSGHFPFTHVKIYDPNNPDQ